jgi:hypothetical protein
MAVGRWRFAGDRTEALTLFLEAIRGRSPHVLKDLFQQVLPQHQEARRRKQQYCDAAFERRHDFWQPDGPDECFWAERVGADGCLHEEPSDADYRFENFWSADYDIKTWRAAWHWVNRWHLGRGMALESLKRRKAIELASWCSKQPYWRRGKRLPMSMSFPFRVDRSPEITFGMPLIETVWFTLQSWAKDGAKEDDLRWKLPHSGARIREVWRVEDFVKLKADPDLRKRLRLGPRFPSVYEFITFGWDVFGGETRAQAKKAIMAALERQVEKQLDETARDARTKPYLERAPKVREKEHFDWLVLYQVGNLNYSEVTRKVNSQPSDSPKVTDEFRSQKAAVTAGIKQAAELLIGPRFTAWLHPREAGRPRST